MKRTFVLPVAMLMGGFMSGVFAPLNAATPYMLFVMLFVTFCRISPSEMRFSPLVLWLIALQILGGAAVYIVLGQVDTALAQGVAICVYAPTAVAAMVVGGLLGADLAKMATMTFFSNLTVGLLSPALFALAGANGGSFDDVFLAVISRVGPLLLIPLAASVILRRATPRLHAAIARRQGITFWLWAVALVITTARTVEFVKEHRGNLILVIAIMASAAAACVAQFAIGRIIGKKYGDPISGGQSMGQKNTLLAIWMAQTYFAPLSSIGPASYVVWQNLVNTLQMWNKSRKK